MTDSSSTPMPRRRPMTNIYRDVEHPFAQYVRILGKGKRGSRSLTYEEACDAFGMILDGNVEEVQLGAFLMLLRVKEESVDELAGFVTAVRDRLDLPDLQVDLDWSSYAGKRRHYPWFLLAALTLAQHGVRVFMHGTSGHTLNRLYTETALSHLGYPLCNSPEQIKDELNNKGFAYMALDQFAPRLAELIELRNTLGLRSPVHTLSRLINPFNANATLQAIFHPAYRASHQETALALGYQNAAVIKGEGGEFERNPDANSLMLGIRNGQPYELEWPMLHETRSEVEESFDMDMLGRVWRGEETHAYGRQAVIGTLALVLQTLGHTNGVDEGMRLATQLWDERHHPTRDLSTKAPSAHL